jgi:hypothetical protein
MKFSGADEPRGSRTGSKLDYPAGEVELQRWNPHHRARIREAGGWTTLTAASLNLHFDQGDFDNTETAANYR